jgi:hypothetical protein
MALHDLKQLLKATDEFKTNTQDIEHDNNYDNAGMLFMHGEEANRYIPELPEWIEPLHIDTGYKFAFAHIMALGNDCLFILDFS